MADRISRIWVEGVRTLEKVSLEVRPLTVLIGENGAGKSTLIEVLELLHRIPSPNFMSDFSGVHGGLHSLLRFDSREIILGVEVEGDEEGPGERLIYSLSIAKSRGFPVIQNESLDHRTPRHADTIRYIVRDGSEAKVFDGQGLAPVQGLSQAQPILGVFGAQPSLPAIHRMKAALDGILVHLPFSVTPNWAARERNVRSPMRDSATLVPADRLERFGANLASAYHALRNNYGLGHWERTLEYVRLGLGESLRDVAVKVDPGGGAVAIALEYDNPRQVVPAVAISDGTFAYLAHVALCRLSTGASLVAFDEPEHHLHPQLLTRVVGLYESLSLECPVMLATHSDRVLDSLTAPEKAAVLIELDDCRSAVLKRPDEPALRKWLEEYSGFAELRNGGHESSFFTNEAT